MSKQMPTLLAGQCPHLNNRHTIIAIYLETRPPSSHVPHYKIIDLECDFSDECGKSDCCPIILNAPKHPPGAGLG